MVFNSTRLLKPIGSGTFAEVWQGEILVSGAACDEAAIKISYKTLGEDEIREQMYSMRFMANLTHPNLLGLRGFDVVENHLWAILELADGNLFDSIASNGLSGDLKPSSHLLHHIQEIADVLDYLHSQKIIHGGVNPGDILIIKEHAKLADPGPNVRELLSKHAHRVSLAKTVCMAPERKCGETTSHSDQFALAATYVWLRLGYSAFKNDYKEPNLGSIPIAEQRVLNKALNMNPNERFGSCLEFYNELQGSISG